MTVYGQERTGLRSSNCSRNVSLWVIPREPEHRHTMQTASVDRRLTACRWNLLPW